MTTRTDPLAWIEADLDTIRALERERLPIHLASDPGPIVTVEGRQLLHLCSNNYLGLAAHPAVIEAAVEATRRYGTGAGASRLVTGGSVLHRELEERLANWHGAEDALVFSSGYLANTGTIAALVGKGDRVVSDALNHASVIDGCKLSGAAVEVYAHADVDDLERKLRASHGGRTLVVTDTVFSMDGDVAPLADIVDACERHGAMLMIDEAHAAGVLGDHGAGAADGLGLAARVPILVGTLSKALGAAGGYVCGTRGLVQLLRNRARTFIFDTAPPPATMAAATAALDILTREPERRSRARWLARELAASLRGLGYTVPEPAACIVPVLLGAERRTLAVASTLRAHGVLAPAIRPPSVPAGACRVRVTTMATHTDAMIGDAVRAFAAAAEA